MVTFLVLLLMSLWGTALLYLRGDHWGWFNIPNRWMKITIFGLPLAGLFLALSGPVTLFTGGMAALIWLGLGAAYSKGHGGNFGNPIPPTLGNWLMECSKLAWTGGLFGVAPALVGVLTGHPLWALSLLFAALAGPIGYTVGWLYRYKDLYPTGNPNAPRPWANEIGDALTGLIFYGPTAALLLLS